MAHWAIHKLPPLIGNSSYWMHAEGWKERYRNTDPIQGKYVNISNMLSKIHAIKMYKQPSA